MARIQDIDSRLASEVLEALRQGLPERMQVIPLGNTAALLLGVPAPTHTKDVDIALALISEKRELADQESVRKFAGKLGGKVEKDPENGSWLRFALPFSEGHITVEVIRGKSRDRPRGKFITRKVLMAVTEGARLYRDELLPSLSDLIVLKAWAATDQMRHLQEEPTNDYHLRRRDAYRDDTRRVTELALDRGELDAGRVSYLLSLMRHDRQEEVRKVLVEAGALEPGA